MSKGVFLALTGALILTPDALFMRLSGMDGFQMLLWRGSAMGVLFLVAWSLTSAQRGRDLRMAVTGTGLMVTVCQYFNNMLFPMGIAAAPVAVVLLGVATVPVWSAILAQVLHGERPARGTWPTIGLVMIGIGLALSGHGGNAAGSALVGALCGLGVAFALALNFVTLRFAPDLPLLLTIGVGALGAGMTGWVVTGPARATDGTLWAIVLTALFILPLAFFLLSAASRHIPAATVSLLMLLETALGPLWVWVGIQEAPGPRALLGAALVIGALAIYLWRQRPG